MLPMPDPKRPAISFFTKEKSNNQASAPMSVNTISSADLAAFAAVDIDPGLGAVPGAASAGCRGAGARSAGAANPFCGQHRHGEVRRRAAGSKVTVGIVLAENQEALELRAGSPIRAMCARTSVRSKRCWPTESFGVRSVAMVGRIIGCPHEEGIDYQGPTCPLCPYWAGRDRWSGERMH
jgi:hypothetical protein